ncbi:hypothetical protein EON65_19870, partial [archaeon]
MQATKLLKSLRMLQAHHPFQPLLQQHSTPAASTVGSAAGSKSSAGAGQPPIPTFAPAAFGSTPAASTVGSAAGSKSSAGAGQPPIPTFAPAAFGSTSATSVATESTKSSDKTANVSAGGGYGAVNLLSSNPLESIDPSRGRFLPTMTSASLKDNLSLHEWAGCNFFASLLKPVATLSTKIFIVKENLDIWRTVISPVAGWEHAFRQTQQITVQSSDLLKDARETLVKARGVNREVLDLGMVITRVSSNESWENVSFIASEHNSASLLHQERSKAKIQIGIQHIEEEVKVWQEKLSTSLIKSSKDLLLKVSDFGKRSEVLELRLAAIQAELREDDSVTESEGGSQEKAIKNIWKTKGRQLRSKYQGVRPKMVLHSTDNIKKEEIASLPISGWHCVSSRSIAPKLSRGKQRESLKVDDCEVPKSLTFGSGATAAKSSDTKPAEKSSASAAQPP